MSACCPPNAEKYLAAGAAPAADGTFSTLPSGLQLYRTGAAVDKKQGVLMLPDIWGWNSGRIRSVADMLALAGFLVVIPKLMTPPLEGGTDGDALYPGFDLSKSEDMAKFGPYFSQFDWDVIGPKIAEATEYLKSEGCEKLGVYGFCWGGWEALKMLAGELGASYSCAAIAHPSVQLEARMFQREVLPLFQACAKPLLLMPAKGDPEEYAEGGEWFITVKANHPSSETFSFPEMNHGFAIRGDINDAVTKANMEKAHALAFEFLAKHMA